MEAPSRLRWPPCPWLDSPSAVSASSSAADNPLRLLCVANHHYCCKDSLMCSYEAGALVTYLCCRSEAPTHRSFNTGACAAVAHPQPGSVPSSKDPRGV